MTKQEIITLLIDDYEWAIEKVKYLTYRHGIIFLDKANIDIGVCFAAKRRHKTDIYGLEWVEKHGVMWHKTPRNCHNKKEVIQSLQTRLDILKQELLIPEE